MSQPQHAGIDRKNDVADCVDMARFTAANAREMAARSHEARRLRPASGKPAGEFSPQSPQMYPLQAADSYVSERLSCVRLQLDRVDGMMMTEKDPQKLDRLASAQARLAEQERILNGRPLPGSMRPRPERRQVPPPLPGPLE
jgi:hypothetical protein